MPGFHHSVLTLPFRRSAVVKFQFRCSVKNYVRKVRTVTAVNGKKNCRNRSSVDIGSSSIFPLFRSANHRRRRAKAYGSGNGNDGNMQALGRVFSAFA